MPATPRKSSAAVPIRLHFSGLEVEVSTVEIVLVATALFSPTGSSLMPYGAVGGHFNDGNGRPDIVGRGFDLFTDGHPYGSPNTSLLCQPAKTSSEKDLYP